MQFDEIRDRLVLAALPHVPFDGWSSRTLAEAAREEGMDPTMPARAFPNGAADVVEHFIGLADRLMAADLAERDLAAMKVSERVFAAIQARLERWGEHKEAIRRATAVLALPQNLPRAARVTWRTADAIWAAVGDASHDFSWYTRRSTLAAVYSATVLYWLEDASEGHADTWGFLRRRLADVGRVTKSRKRLEGWLDKLPRPGFPGGALMR